MRKILYIFLVALLPLTVSAQNDNIQRPPKNTVQQAPPKRTQPAKPANTSQHNSPSKPNTPSSPATSKPTGYENGYVSHNISATKTLLLNDFFPVEGVTLGKTTWKEAQDLGFNVKIYKDGPDRHTNFSNGASLWDHAGNGIFTHIYMVQSDSMFPLWQSLGMSWGLSWNEWIQFFKNHGFIIKVLKGPVTKEYSGRKTLSGELEATSSDGSIQFSLKFNYGNDSGEGYSVTAKNTLYSITVDCKH